MDLGARARAWRRVSEHSPNADPSWGPAISALPAPPTQPCVSHRQQPWRTGTRTRTRTTSWRSRRRRGTRPVPPNSCGLRTVSGGRARASGVGSGRTDGELPWSGPGPECAWRGATVCRCAAGRPRSSQAVPHRSASRMLSAEREAAAAPVRRSPARTRALFPLRLFPGAFISPRPASVRTHSLPRIYILITSQLHRANQ